MNTFTLTFTIEEMKIIDTALGNMSYKDVAALIANINEQIKKANEPKLESVKTEDK